jgi:hypothetical protein
MLMEMQKEMKKNSSSDLKRLRAMRRGRIDAITGEHLSMGM